MHFQSTEPASQQKKEPVADDILLQTSSTSVLVAAVVPIVVTSLLEHLDAWAIQDFLLASTCTHASTQQQSLQDNARALRQTLEILTLDIQLPGLPGIYNVKLIPQHLLDQQFRHRNFHASARKPAESKTANPTGHSRHVQELLRKGQASTFPDLVRKMNPGWRHDRRFHAFLHFLDDSHTTVSYMPQFSQSEFHVRDIISPARLQPSFRYQNHAGLIHLE